MNKEAVRLYFTDEKNKRTLDIITELLGSEPNNTEIAKKYGLSRRAIIDIKNKYLNQ